MDNSNTIISHCICHSIVKILYIVNGKRGSIREKLGTEELRCTTLCATTMHIELYVCMYFIACYYELLMLIYMNLTFMFANFI